ncbi:uncharacterized protein LOC112533561 isoform X2 [Gallus gallus]|uniref:uncharacterized protein LOC112533561 isoform X2 n=1 Tax=Gallus gallus TaxID=9031 RepID=UPI000D6406BF|nr:uncharacterized protein LOC112533561 isoform X2 [Gallus gallus]|eukprot:XP_025011731.1 uncharacterized protein LOC107049645 isoform X2 [Gallus gallus]
MPCAPPPRKPHVYPWSHAEGSGYVLEGFGGGQGALDSSRRVWRCPRGVLGHSGSPHVGLEGSGFLRRVWRCPGGVLGRPGGPGVLQESQKLTVPTEKAPYGHQVMWGKPQVTPGQLPAPTFVPVTVEPGAIPTLIYAESSVSILKFREPGDAVSLTSPVSPAVLPAAVVQLEGCDILIKEACLQPDLVTLELSGAVTIMCHKDGDVVVYSAATRGDRV